MQRSSDSNPLTLRLGRLITLLVLASVVAAFAAAPLLAWHWLQTPFPGLMVEPTLVLSPMEGREWARLQLDPPLEQPDRLVAIDGQRVSNASDLSAILDERTRGDRVTVTVEDPDGARRAAVVRLRSFPLRDLLLMFFVPYLAGAAYLGIGIWVYWARGGDRAAQACSGLCAAVALMMGLLFDLNTTHRLAALWSAAVPLAASAAMHLSMVFPKEPRFVQRFPVLRLLPHVPAVVLAFRSLMVVYDVNRPWAYIARWRNSYFYCAVGIFFLLAMLVYRLIKPPTPLVRQQSRIILLGASLGFLPFLPWLLLNALGYIVPFNPALYAPLFTLFPLSIAYAILRYRLLDVDRLFSRGLTYGLLTVIIVGGYFGLVDGLSLFLAIRADNPLLVSLFVLALVLLFNPLRNGMQRLVDRIFLRGPVDYGTTLQHFSRELTQSLDLEEVLAEVGRRIEDTVHPIQQWAFLFEEGHQHYAGRPIGHAAAAAAAPVPFPTHSALARWLRDHTRCLYLPAERPLPDELAAAGSEMETLDAVLFAPLRTRERLTGWLALDRKRSGHPYTHEDLAFLAALADQSALAVENARLFSSLNRNLAATTEMKNLMDDVFGSIPSGVITTDIQNRITLFNRAAEAILGLQASESVGQLYQQVLTPLGDNLTGLIEEVLHSDAVVVAHELQPELPLRGPVWLRLSLSPLKDSQDSTTGVTMVFDDLTERRRLEAQERFIRETFQRYVSPGVVLKLLEDPGSLQLGGQRQEISVLFADIRGFTAFSELRNPEQLVEVLNHYLAIGADAVLAEEGTLDKFMGDALMALFNAPLAQPDHTLRAVRAALTMQSALREHQRQVPAENRLDYGVGIAVGEAVVGNIGTTQQLTYTAIGVAVNLAKRLQENAHGGQILLSRRAYEQVQQQVEAQPLAPMSVEGFRNPVQVYELLRLYRP